MNRRFVLIYVIYLVVNFMNLNELLVSGFVRNSRKITDFSLERVKSKLDSIEKQVAYSYGKFLYDCLGGSRRERKSSFAFYDSTISYRFELRSQSEDKVAFGFTLWLGRKCVYSVSENVSKDTSREDCGYIANWRSVLGFEKILEAFRSADSFYHLSK